MTNNYGWECPSDAQVKEFSKLCIPHVKFLNPAVIESIVNNNRLMSSEFERILKKYSVAREIYTWEGSACLFPGIRRHAGKEESRDFNFSKARKFADAIAVDSNTYPKHVWTFIFTGKKFTTVGPDGYSLAHLVDHKTYSKKRLSEKFGSEVDELLEKYRNPFSGLFTAATNSIFIADGLLKPTDNNGYLRDLLILHALKQYGGTASLFPFSLEYNFSEEVRRDYTKYDWPKPVGTTERLDEFYEHRKKIYEEF